MIIREADLDLDALSIMDGARDFASRIAFSHLLPNDDQVFVDTVGKVVNLKGMEILLAEHEGKVVGGMGILYAPFIWNTDRLMADQIFWWMAKDAPFRAASQLIENVMTCIRIRKAIPIFHVLSTSAPSMEWAYRKLGLEPVDTVFTELH